MLFILFIHKNVEYLVVDLQNRSPNQIAIEK